MHLEARGVKFAEGKSRQTRCERHRYVLQDGTRSPVCVRCGAPSAVPQTRSVGGTRPKSASGKFDLYGPVYDALQERRRVDVRLRGRR